ncbi:MAG TPA: hypothetical protein VEX40_00765, partial [Mycobacterium sp.]|nr:hypothetical protein [Mycobacterium sp.]
ATEAATNDSNQRADEEHRNHRRCGFIAPHDCNRASGQRFDSAQPVSLNHSWVREYDVQKEALAVS